MDKAPNLLKLIREEQISYALFIISCNYLRIVIKVKLRCQFT